MDKKIKMLAAAVLLLVGIRAHAQIVTGGTDPGGVRWKSVSTPHYRIIYPEGLDSLSRVYGRQLERYRTAESWSTGQMPGQGYKRPTPVILHPFTGVSNGSVSWAPREMDLYTLPMAYGAEPLPWEANLAVHEGRHLSQMQLGYRGLLKPLTWVLGDMWPGAVAGIYPSLHLLEGDAVVAETALTGAGRGRQAAFLEYYRAAFAEGDMRNWYRWRYGSFRHAAPNHYAIGYATIAGARAFYDDPLFMAEYFNAVSRHPFRLCNMQKQLSAASGLSFRDTWKDIQNRYAGLWADAAKERGPFSESEPLTENESWYVEYSDPVISSDGSIYAVRSGLREASSLVKVAPDGSVGRIRPFSSGAGGMNISDDGRLWWSEPVPDRRWGLGATSRIRYMDPDSSSRVHDLTREGRYFNPAPSPDGARIAAVSFPYEGGSVLVLLGSGSGDELFSLAAPDSLHFAETEWIGERVYVTGVSASGIGLYSIEPSAGEHELRQEIAPGPFSIGDLTADDEALYFASDRSGVRELYAFSSGVCKQLTSSEIGAGDPMVLGGSVFFTSPSRGGVSFRRLVSGEGREVSFGSWYSDPVAATLTAQEKALAAESGFGGEDLWSEDVPDVEFSAEKRFRRFPSAVRLHSWAPVYFRSDEVASSSFEEISTSSTLGATVMFQSLLGTLYGTAGYSYDPGAVREHGGHVELTWTGLYPVIKASVELGHSKAAQYFRRRTGSGGLYVDQVSGKWRDAQLVTGELEAYVPLNFSSGGWLRGIIPDVKYAISNSRYSKGIALLDSSSGFEDFTFPAFKGYIEGANVPMQTIDASVRAYVMRPVAESGVYPRFGAGGTIGFKSRLGLSDIYTAGAYVNIYGFLPGFVPQQGLRLSVLGQHLFSSSTAIGENAVKTRPRGFEDSSVGAYLASAVPDQLRLSADYAIPVYVGDISFLSPLLYVRNFILTPHADVTVLRNGSSTGSLFSVGSDFEVAAANFLWLPYPCRFGLGVDWNGGSVYGVAERFFGASRTAVRWLFTMDF